MNIPSRIVRPPGTVTNKQYIRIDRNIFVLKMQRADRKCKSLMQMGTLVFDKKNDVVHMKTAEAQYLFIYLASDIATGL